MMQTLINSGKYTFVGTLGELKKILRIQSEISRDGMCCGSLDSTDVTCPEYNGKTHRFKDVKDFLKDDVLYLEYKGC